MTDLPTIVPGSIRDVRSLAFAALADRLAGLPIRANRVMDIDQVTDSALPALMEHFDVATLASYCESGDACRALIKEALTLHRRRGTRWAAARLAQLSGADLVLADTPPGKLFCGAARTDAERAAFEAVHPALRVWPYQKAGQREGLMVGDCLGSAAPLRSTALIRIGDRLELFDPLSGTGTDLNTLAVDQERLPSVARQNVAVRTPGVAAGQFVGTPLVRATVDQQADARYYTLDLARPYAAPIERWRHLSLTPGLSPLTGYYTPLAIPGVARGIFPGATCIGGQPCRSDAAYRLGKQLRLYDPGRAQAISHRSTGLYLGAVRLPRLNAQHARVVLDLRRTTHPWKAFACPRHDRTFPVASTAAAAIDRARQALSWAARASDAISLSTAPRGPLTVSPATRVGVVLGQYQLETL